MGLHVPRQIGNVDFAADQQKSLLIDRDGVLAQLNLRLKFTVTAGSSAMVGPKWNTIARLLKRVEVIMGGRDTVFSMDGAGIVQRALDDFGVTPQGMGDSFVLTGSSTVTTYDIVLPIAFWSPRGRRPDDTALDLRKVKQATLRVTWGDIDDLVGTVNSAAISAVTLDVDAHYMLDVPDNAVYLVRQQDMLEEELTGSNENFTMVLDGQTGLLMRSALLVTLVNDALDGSVVDDGKLTVESGSFKFQSRDGKLVRGDNTLMHARAQEAGVYNLEFLKWGEGAQLINTGGLTSNLNLVADATKQSGTNVLKIYRESWRPLKVA